MKNLLTSTVLAAAVSIASCGLARAQITSAVTWWKADPTDPCISFEVNGAGPVYVIQPSDVNFTAEFVAIVKSYEVYVALGSVSSAAHAAPFTFYPASSVPSCGYKTAATKISVGVQ